MRRTLAGLLFGLAYACAAFTIAGFILQQTAFNPDRSADAADVVLEDSEIKNELIDVISSATASQLGQDEASVRALVASVAEHPEGQRILAEVIHDAHAHLIGVQKEPVQITGEQLVPILRTEAAASLPPITLDVPAVTPLDYTRRLLGWIVPIAAIATLVLVGLGFFAHPERSALLRSLSFGLLLLALLVALLGYIVPVFIIPLLNDTPWAQIPGQLANNSLPLLIGLELLLVGAALALLAGSGMANRRRRWSAPVSTYRYSEERNWSG
ncbi:MAG TPA: hypothetical protein VMS14_03315 [Ilumatobacteraceae bacterium]|nr:hypothetical protein [Ilumatobacteraceae bacterium]